MRQGRRKLMSSADKVLIWSLSVKSLMRTKVPKVRFEPEMKPPVGTSARHLGLHLRRPLIPASNPNSDFVKTLDRLGERITHSTLWVFH